MVGSELGQYVIEARLGAGGMGVVYRAFDRRLERPVAIKMFPGLAADPAARLGLLNEGRAASALNHPNICTVYEVGEHEGLTYLVMEHIEGRALSTVLLAGGLPVETITVYGSQVAGAVAHAHARGVVHRDLKSANIMITPDGRAKVLDFGIAVRHVASDRETAVKPANTLLGDVAGTVAYMAPEALRGVADTRTDVWALGVVLYEMVTAALPFQGHATLETCARILNDPLPPLPDHVPPVLRSIVQRCLAKDPAHRYENAGELKVAIETLQSATLTPSRLAIIVPERRDERRSILVLPFTNLSPDPQSDYFSDGLTDEIIADLSNVRQFRVISRTSSMQLKGTSRSLSELASQMHVEHVIEGSVRRSGAQLRVTCKLVHAASDSAVWSQKYSGTLDDVFLIQETIAGAIADALRVTLSPEEVRRIREHPIADLQAYEWYLRGKQELLRFTKESLDRAIGYLEKSAAIAGDNVLILAATGQAYWQYVNAAISADPVYLDKADACAQRILAIDPDSPHGYRVAGLVRIHRGDLQGAVVQLKRALDADPNDPDSLLWGCLAASISGKAAAANSWAARLVEIDPVTPFHQAMPGGVAYMSGDFDRAYELSAASLAAFLDNPILHLVYGQILAATGRVSESVRVLDDLARSQPENPFGQLAAVFGHALQGHRDAVSAGLTPALLQALENDPQYCWTVAQCFALVGEVDEGICWTAAAVAHGFLNYPMLATRDPFLAPLRSDPRYQSLLADVERRWRALDA